MLLQTFLETGNYVVKKHFVLFQNISSPVQDKNHNSSNIYLLVYKCFRFDPLNRFGHFTDAHVAYTLDSIHSTVLFFDKETTSNVHFVFDFLY